MTNPLGGNVKDWEFRYAIAASDLFRESLKHPTKFSDQVAKILLINKLNLAFHALSTVVATDPNSDPIVAASKVGMTLSLVDYMIIVNLAILGVEKACEALEIQTELNRLESLFPKFS